MSNKTDRELLQAAFNYLMLPGAYVYIDGVKALREEIRVRLAEPEDEPFAWFSPQLTETYMATWYKPHDGDLPLYRHPRQPVRLSDEEILAIAEKYGTSSTRHKPTYHLHNGSPTGETYPITDWDFGQDDLLGFARELLEKNQ